MEEDDENEKKLSQEKEDKKDKENDEKYVDQEDNEKRCHKNSKKWSDIAKGIKSTENQDIQSITIEGNQQTVV